LKTFWTAGLLALGVLCLSQQQASAWVNAKFGVGLNIAWQSGGNCFGWGLVHGDQPPEPIYGPAFPDFGFYPPPAAPVIYGHAMGGPAPAPTATKSAPTPSQNSAYYYQPNYQTMTFPGYYTTPNYYYPAAYYYYGR
jgi:hypothetical protein